MKYNNRRFRPEVEFCQSRISLSATVVAGTEYAATGDMTEVGITIPVQIADINTAIGDLITDLNAAYPVDISWLFSDCAPDAPPPQSPVLEEWAAVGDSGSSW